MSLFAKADVTLKSGSLAKLKTSKEKVYVVWDYSHGTLEGKDVKSFLKEKGAEWERDYKAELERAEANFMERFNDKTKSVTVTDKKSEADYTIVVHVKDFHYGSTGACPHRFRRRRCAHECADGLLREEREASFCRD